MNSEIIRLFDSASSRKLADALKRGKTINLSNVKSGLKGFLTLYLKQTLNRNILYICASDREARDRAEALSRWAGTAVDYFPAQPVHEYFSDAHSPETERQRMAVIEKTFGRSRRVICTSVDALLKRMPDPKTLRSRFIHLKSGDTIEPSDLAAMLADIGYQRMSQVDGQGQFALRGEVFDIFPVTGENGVRLDFFDDEIESIAAFDVVSQRSRKALKSLVIPPARDAVLSSKERNSILSKIDEDGFDPDYAELIEEIKADPGSRDETLSCFIDRDFSFVDYIKEDSVVFWDEYDRCREMSGLFLEKAQKDFESLIDQHLMFPEEQHKFFDFEKTAMDCSKHPQVMADLFASGESHEIDIDFNAKSIESFTGRIPYFTQFVRRRLDDGFRVVICCKTEKTGENMRRFLNDQELADYSDGDGPGIVLTTGEISEGFELPGEKLVFINESEIFAEERRKRRRRKKPGRKIDSFSSLAVGDYVVHDIHGIGIYKGIEKMTIGETTKDMMVIAYKGDDRLYIPVEQMNTVQAYIGTGGDRKPKINTLGRPDWAKTKAKAKKAVEDMADELIALYAKRRSQPGYAFGKDTVWQKEFEDQFEYEETDDQIRCIDEIKKDMEQPVPMDRLLCGDVGYGKTEVALRAAFKAVMDNKQVAILVPTTILAEQHYNTMVRRFSRFPVTIEVLSRFKTARQQNAVLKELAAGRIDIIVGTHRLLSKDVEFRDLGLLIVDEEQRFGVRAKEKLKSFRENVDVLTLSATPIPRTLHMSMTGIRDMSVIAEPPKGRKPVQTYVLKDNPIVIGDAIQREIARGGQVFFVHNRIKDIRETAAKVALMAPNARIVVAHGRMSGEELENIMLDFLNREYDVLVTTAIVESGMDVNNANTMIIDNGDTMGLSQLYQLRGRVGRSRRQAYCYIVYHKQVLSEVAAKRLKAIRDFTAFGSGFKIAMRDLEIRGAGNILGAEQSGHLYNVGYEMYCRILEETIAEHSGGQKVQKEKQPVKINLDIDAFIPENYIENEVVKYDVYKKIATIQDDEDREAMREELKDRFGSIPKEVDNLLGTAMMGRIAENFDIVEIRQRGNAVRFYFDENVDVPLPDGLTIQRLFEEYSLKLKADKKRDNVWQIIVDTKKQSRLIESVLDFLKNLKNRQINNDRPC